MQRVVEDVWKASPIRSDNTVKYNLNYLLQKRHLAHKYYTQNLHVNDVIVCVDLCSLVSSDLRLRVSYIFENDIMHSFNLRFSAGA